MQPRSRVLKQDIYRMRAILGGCKLGRHFLLGLQKGIEPVRSFADVLPSVVSFAHLSRSV